MMKQRGIATFDNIPETASRYAVCAAAYTCLYAQLSKAENQKQRQQRLCGGGDKEVSDGLVDYLR